MEVSSKQSSRHQEVWALAPAFSQINTDHAVLYTSSEFWFQKVQRNRCAPITFWDFDFWRVDKESYDPWCMTGKVASCHYWRLVEHSTNPDKIRRQKMMSKMLSGISFSKAGLQQFLNILFSFSGICFCWCIRQWLNWKLVIHGQVQGAMADVWQDQIDSSNEVGMPSLSDLSDLSLFGSDRSFVELSLRRTLLGGWRLGEFTMPRILNLCK